MDMSYSGTEILLTVYIVFFPVVIGLYGLAFGLSTIETTDSGTSPQQEATLYKAVQIYVIGVLLFWLLCLYIKTTN